MSNAVPHGWEEATILELGNNHKDTVQTGPFGAQLHASDYKSDGVPLILIRNIKDYGLDERNIPKISHEDAERLHRYRLKVGDIVFSRVGRVGSCFLTTKRESGWVISGQTLRMRVDLKKVNPEFLVYGLRTDEIQKEIVGESVGSTRTSINTTILENLQVPVPPLHEQQKIAAILSSVDDVIEKTRAQIDKLKDLKTGMMQELLTKGIGHTAFKDSPVGRIPEAWDVALLDKVASRGSGHTPSKSKSEYWNGGVDWVSLSDTNKLDRLYISTTAKSISEKGVRHSSAVIHPPGIVVLSRDAGIGKSAITTKEMAVSQHFIVWDCSDRLDNHFLYYVMQFLKPVFENIAMGSTIKTIGLSFFKKLVVPLPSLDEQRRISGSLKSIDEKIFATERKVAQISKMKKALMQDLLTGKVRVNVDNKENAVA